MGKTRQDIVGLARVCQDSYESLEKGKPNWGLKEAGKYGYKAISKSSARTIGGGFFALAFEKADRSDEIVIAVRGTVKHSLSDRQENIRLMNGVNKNFFAFKAKMKNKGKHNIVIIVALMRKLIHIIFAILKNKSSFSYDLS